MKTRTTKRKKQPYVAAAIAGLCAAVSGSAIADEVDAFPAVSMFSTNCRVLFQGDSITDGNRGRGKDPNHILGHGYVFIIAAGYGGRNPDLNIDFVNRGCSANSVVDLQARWQADAINLKPDVLSIAIGINDYAYTGVPLEKYEQQYDQLLSNTVQALPAVRLVLCEPFGLPVGRFKDKWEVHRTELAKRQAVVARLAKKYNAILVQFQKAFDDACKRAAADYWIWDGVHPTYRGHQVMADAWIRTVAGAKVLKTK